MTEPDLDDIDNPEWTEEDFRRARPSAEVFGVELLTRRPASVASSLTRQGGAATRQRLAA